MNIEIPHDKIHRILVIRRNRMGDMICTLPLLRALRQKFPGAVIRVACEKMGEPIARACSAVDEVVLLKKGINRLHTLYYSRRNTRGFDLVIGAKGGYDRHLAWMVRCSGAKYRIGFSPGQKSFYYNHPIPIVPGNEHQIDKCFRLLAPLGIRDAVVDLHLDLPPDALDFAEQLARANGVAQRFFTVFSLSSNRAAWGSENFSALGRLILQKSGGVIGLSCMPEDRPLADEIMDRIGSGGTFVFHSQTPLELAAVFKRVDLLVTPEGGAAHLAAVMETPTVILWPRRGPFTKWKSLSSRHHDLRATGSLDTISVADVWNVVEREFLSVAPFSNGNAGLSGEPVSN